MDLSPSFPLRTWLTLQVCIYERLKAMESSIRKRLFTFLPIFSIRFAKSSMEEEEEEEEQKDVGTTKEEERNCD